MCLVDLKKAVGRVLRNVLERATRMKGIPEVWVRSVMRVCMRGKDKS